jgi:putative tryptophan/tyrosine transport system substrate-binding protein
MRRREFIAGIGVTAMWPVVVRAQQRVLPVIGYLDAGSESARVPFTAAFRQGLGEQGYVEGQNVEILYRWAESRYDRLPALAADLVRRRVSVIHAQATPSALAAKSATEGPCVDGSGLARVFFTCAALVGAAMCSAC